MIKKTTTTIILCLILSACGYHIAGMSEGTALKYYIEPIVNKTSNVSYGNTAQNFIDRYFIKYGELTSENKANHYLRITLSKITITDDIVSATDEATLSNMNITLQLVVKNKEGAEVFSKTYKSSSAFGISANISQSLSSRDAALKSSIESILENFRSAVNAELL